MRDPLGLNERVFALVLPRPDRAVGTRGERERRRDLLSTARGCTLEIGAGGGHNLAHYPSAVSELVVTEPSPHMIRHLSAELARASAVGRLVRIGTHGRRATALRRRELRHRRRDIRALHDPRSTRRPRRDRARAEAGRRVSVHRARPQPRQPRCSPASRTSSNCRTATSRPAAIPIGAPRRCSPSRPSPSSSWSTNRCHARCRRSVRPSAASPEACSVTIAHASLPLALLHPGIVARQPR